MIITTTPATMVELACGAFDIIPSGDIEIGDMVGCPDGPNCEGRCYTTGYDSAVISVLRTGIATNLVVL